ncbi:hypothetical protein CEK26_003338 [Fusarium fujikuroi]|nr:hypothetical protein CEK27_003332 [Fusarium fujikuroi]QGI88337.1 hypothetical protein CEK25_003293 [Fusarium fujikuroi]QGJ01894.1 hypothetical protein CEK26_003338 [Fusarium fujikuroi]
MDSFKGLEALSMAALTRVLGWTQEEVTIFLAKVRRDLNDRTIHAYWPVPAANITDTQLMGEDLSVEAVEDVEG